MKNVSSFWSSAVKSNLTRDYLAALAWAIFVGLPVFTLHMVILDYEHYTHGMSLRFSLGMSLKNMFPYHPVSIGLWVVAVFITALSVRRVFRRQRELIEMQREVKRAQSDADTDALTGLLNRRAFDRGFKEIFEAARQSKRAFTVMMIDVDGFKSMNDTQGHLAGDRALQSIARVLTRFVRSQDILARYGGDEFVLLCPTLSAEDAVVMAKRFKTLTLPMGLGLSMGLATYPLDGASMADIVQVADQRMYEEKRIHHR